MSQFNLVNAPQPISSHHQCLGLTSGLLPSGLPIKILYAPLLSPYVLHAPPISFFLIRSPKYLVSTDHTVYHYVIFPTPLLSHLLHTQISSLAPYSRTPSACVPCSLWETKFHTHTKYKAKL